MAAYVESIRRAPRTLTEREQKALLRVTGEHRAGWRDHVLFAMALGTGLRAHELVALDVGDVFDDAGRVRHRLALRVFKGDGRSLRRAGPGHFLELPPIERGTRHSSRRARRHED
jgi:integrase